MNGTPTTIKELIAELSAIENQDQIIVYAYKTFTDLVEVSGFWNLTPELLAQFIQEENDEYFYLTFMEGGTGFYSDLSEFLEEETGEGNPEDEMFDENEWWN